MNQNKLFLSYDLLKRIRAVDGEINWKIENKEHGWHIEKVPEAHFTFNIIFDNDAARVMFYLKYGIK